MIQHETYFITWTTYGTWLPGDSRGWRKREKGNAVPQPLLERWCREQMTGDVVLLADHDRQAVESACREHCEFRGWSMLAISVRSNHLHVVVVADEKPQKVRDQLKANATRCLRLQDQPLNMERTWTRGGDCEIVKDEDVETVWFTSPRRRIQSVVNDDSANPRLGRVE